MRVFVPTLLFALCVAGLAHGKALPYPPSYFSQYRVALAIAELVTEKCSKLELDQSYYDKTSTEMIDRIAAEGFDRKNWESQMREIPVGIRDQVAFEFFFAFGVRDDRPESYCSGGHAAMERKTAVGKFLKMK